MSKKVHPLFKTRGVPGTHDIDLIKNFFNLAKRKNFKKIKIPRFDKSRDDRLKKKYWMNIKKKPEIVILEGWCVGARSQSNSLIKKPINDLEKYEDKDSKWRKYVNKKLNNEYKFFFKMIDHFIFMKIPNFKMVFKWRLLQENKLRKKSYLNKKVMSINEIKRFIMFYERITLQMIKDLSKSASIVMFLKNNHQVKKVLFK
jgi:D-glycerate 3-kinase